MIEKIVAQLTDEEITQAFFEEKQLRETAILPDGVIRNTIEKIKQACNTTFSITQMAHEILYEGARRKYLNS